MWVEVFACSSVMSRVLEDGVGGSLAKVFFRKNVTVPDVACT